MASASKKGSRLTNTIRQLARIPQPRCRAVDLHGLAVVRAGEDVGARAGVGGEAGAVRAVAAVGGGRRFEGTGEHCKVDLKARHFLAFPHFLNRSKYFKVEINVEDLYFINPLTFLFNRY